jgi:hypothetical protein
MTNEDAGGATDEEDFYFRSLAAIELVDIESVPASRKQPGMCGNVKVLVVAMSRFLVG